MPIATALPWPSNALRKADFAVSCPAVTTICASPNCQSSNAAVSALANPSVASSTNATRCPEKKPCALMASSKMAGSLRKSAAGMRVRRISSSPCGPMSVAMAVCRAVATRIVSAPNISRPEWLGSGLRKYPCAPVPAIFIAANPARPVLNAKRSNQPMQQKGGLPHRLLLLAWQQSIRWRNSW